MYIFAEFWPFLPIDREKYNPSPPIRQIYRKQNTKKRPWIQKKKYFLNEKTWHEITLNRKIAKNTFNKRLESKREEIDKGKKDLKIFLKLLF